MVTTPAGDPPSSGERPHGARSAAEVRLLREAQESGTAHVLLRDGEHGLRVILLPVGLDRAVVGRRPENRVPVLDDSLVSRSHAVLERVGEGWAVVDGGISRNGTSLNGRPVRERHVLRDRDVIRVGHTDILVRLPGARGSLTTALDQEVGRRDALIDSLTRRERAILVALCRPIDPVTGEGSPAPNAAIGDEVHMEEGTVKVHLRDLYKKFGIALLPQNEKRNRLAELAIRWGAVVPGARPRAEG